MAASKANTKKSPPKAPAKKAAKAAEAPAKAAKKANLSVKERFSKSDILNHISTQTELNRKQVTAVLDELNSLIEAHIGKKGPGEFVLPGLMKIVTVKKPARKARKGINPFTGEETTFAAKPASVQVKVRPLKKMKEMVV